MCFSDYEGETKGASLTGASEAEEAVVKDADILFYSVLSCPILFFFFQVCYYFLPSCKEYHIFPQLLIHFERTYIVANYLSISEVNKIASTGQLMAVPPC